MHHQNCIICQSPKIRPLKGYERHGLMKCGQCHFVFMRQMPTNDELQTYYDTYCYDQEHYLSPVTIGSYNKLLDEFERYRVNNKILDFGCGMGYFLDEAKKRGWQVFGRELSTFADKACREKGITMVPDKAYVNGENDFDVVTSFEVIEHLKHPMEEINKVQKSLRKGGLFYCTTPNFNSLMRHYLKDSYNVIEYPEHLSYFTKGTLKKVVAGNEFKTNKILSTGISITRLKASASGKKLKAIIQDSSDELLRVNIEKKWYLAMGKKLTNYFLTLTNTGLTLKGYFVKK
jgi:2-polyprenyl-3-methyl-5-hydroxy-6-metoxy-1,4-benzoquinol methylase